MRIRGFNVAVWITFGSEEAKSESVFALEDVVVERAMDCLFV